MFSAPACSEAVPDKAADVSSTTANAAPIPLWGDYPHERPACIKGIHLSAWYTGTKKGREKFEKLLAETELNTVVIDIKESEGDVYIPGVKLAGEPNYVKAMPDIKEYIKFLKDRGVYVIARQVVFHDNKVARKKPDWAVRSASPIAKAAEKGYRKDVWVDRKGSAWADAMNEDVWDYNIDIAVKAAEIGFQEVQYDYIRFPSDGPTKFCIYSRPHTKESAPKALADFLARSRARLKKEGVTLSIDVFGLVGSSKDDMGIGQKLGLMADQVDAVSPMMYPSHYYDGEFGLASPNRMPYETIYRSIKDTKKMLGSRPVELRPWLQDFSYAGVKYGGKQIRDQIDAALDQGVGEWLLWNASCRYTRSGLLPLPTAAEQAEESKPADPKALPEPKQTKIEPSRNAVKKKEKKEAKASPAKKRG